VTNSFLGWCILVLRFLRVAYGVLLVSILFVPFGIYNTMAEPYVSGVVWGFMLPVGYIAAASGIAIIFYPQTKAIKKLGFGYLLMLIGASMLLSSLIFPRELSISLLHGTNMIDIDYSTFYGALFWLSLLNVCAGFAVKVNEKRKK
jgi:hypothetical protein